LRQALAIPHIKLQAIAQNQTLRIFVLGSPLPAQRLTVQRLKPVLADLPWHQIQIEGYDAGATTPTWTEHFTQPPAAGPCADIIPGHLRSSQPPPKAQHEAPMPIPPRRRAASQVRQLTSTATGALLTGLGLALALTTLGPLRVLFRGFLILVHELGHAITYWIFGYPAVPSVNLLHGGGITLALNRLWPLVWLILLGLAYLLYRYRQSTNSVSWLLAITGLYSFCALTLWHQRLIAYMGHGAETLAISVCLYCAMGGYRCRHGGERTIYAMLGFFTWFEDIRFAGGLLWDADLQANYLNGIGGVLDNDFVRLADDLGTGLASVAGCFLVTTILMPILTGLAFRYEQSWQHALGLTHR
jgi:hypothetical protein